MFVLSHSVYSSQVVKYCPVNVPLQLESAYFVIQQLHSTCSEFSLTKKQIYFINSDALCNNRTKIIILCLCAIKRKRKIERNYQRLLLRLILYPYRLTEPLNLVRHSFKFMEATNCSACTVPELLDLLFLFLPHSGHHLFYTVIQFRNIYSQKCTSTDLAPKFEI